MTQTDPDEQPIEAVLFNYPDQEASADLGTFVRRIFGIWYAFYYIGLIFDYSVAIAVSKTGTSDVWDMYLPWIGSSVVGVGMCIGIASYTPKNNSSLGYAGDIFNAAWYAYVAPAGNISVGIFVLAKAHRLAAFITRRAGS